MLINLRCMRLSIKLYRYLRPTRTVVVVASTSVILLLSVSFLFTGRAMFAISASSDAEWLVANIA